MFFAFWLFWVLLNGTWSAEVVLLGLPAAGLLTLLCYRVLGYDLGKSRFFLRRLGRELGYLLHLVREIVRAAVVIIGFIYSGRREVEPVLVFFKGGLRTPEAKAILADSITLTAGTIAVGVEGNLFCVHALDRSLAEGVEDSSFARRLRELER